VLDRTTFFSLLSEEFLLQGELRGSETLIEDLGFDSLELYRLAAFMDDHGTVLPEQLDYDTLKLEDVWYYYQVQATRTESHSKSRENTL
jgi:hypothetical protein